MSIMSTMSTTNIESALMMLLDAVRSLWPCDERLVVMPANCSFFAVSSLVTAEDFSCKSGFYFN